MSVSTTRWADRTSLLLSSLPFGATDLGVRVWSIQFGGKEFRSPRQAQMQIRSHTDLDATPGQLVVEGVSAAAPFGIDEMRVVPGHRHTLFVVGHPEAEIGRAHV